MSTTKRGFVAAVATIGAALAIAPASWAALPAATTGGTTKVTADAAQLHGTVNPRGLATTYYFEYGITRRYGSRTPDTNAGKGTKNVNAVANVGGLKANTTYHYRLVASNPDGVTSGSDRAFTTTKQPLGLAFNATPNPITSGGRANLAGQPTGTGNAAKQTV